MTANISASKNSISLQGFQIIVSLNHFLLKSGLILLVVMFLGLSASGIASDSNIPSTVEIGFEMFTDSTDSSTGINLPNIEPRPNLTKEDISGNNPPPTIPELIFCLNDTLATEGYNYSFCSTTSVEFSLCEIINGVAPFTICFELDTDANCVSGIGAGDVLLMEDLYPGNHTIKITSITDALGNGSPYTESLNYTIEVTNPPSANAGIDFTICESTGHVFNTAFAESYSSLLWTGGDGTFIPSAEVLNPMYMPGPNDIANGILEISLTANSDQPCNAASTDFMTLSIRTNAVSDAGPDITVCEDQQFVALSGNVQNGLPIWESPNNSGGFFENPLSNSTKYYFSASDIETGTIQLNLIGIPAAPCVLPQLDFVEVTIIKAPDAFAGNDITIADTENIILDQATAENATAVEWSTNGDGTFSNINQINPTYFPGMNDIAEGEVKLIITAMPEGGCTMNSMDLITIDIIQAESVENPNTFQANNEPDAFKSGAYAAETQTSQLVIETTVFPNPATDFVNVKSNQEIAEVLLMNTGGMKILNQPVDARSTTLQVSHLEPGVYILMMEFQGQTRTTKKITIR